MASEARWPQPCPLPLSGGPTTVGILAHVMLAATHVAADGGGAMWVASCVVSAAPGESMSAMLGSGRKVACGSRCCGGARVQWTCM
jgi:hypothetical protein